MTLIRKICNIGIQTLPILCMVGLIPVIQDDVYLTVAFIAIIIVSFLIKRERNEITIFIAGFCLMIFFEYIFIATGVETFIRNSLFNMMPLWLPFLWGYGFVAIKRSTLIINR